MRPSRYEVLLWVLTLLLLLAPYAATVVAYNIALPAAQNGEPCFNFENQQIPCPVDSPVYGLLLQLAPPLIGAGAALIGVSLAVRAVITSRVLAMRVQSVVVPETPKRVSVDHDLFKRPRSSN